MVSVWGKKQLGGYAGLKNTANQISKFFPNKPIYVEPFAGLGRTAIYSKAEKIILNDMSDFAYNYLVKTFPNAIITKENFTKCMLKHDSYDTFYLIDPPWRNLYYYNEKSYYDRKVKQYYIEILELVENMKSDWILCSSWDERGLGKILTKSKWNNRLVESKKNVIFGKKAKTLLTSNMW